MEKPLIKRVRKSSKNESVQVVVRCRPMSEKEKLAENSCVVDVWPSRGVIEITNPKDRDIGRESKKTFTYDAVYDSYSTQQLIYDETVRPLVLSVLEGFNGCVFAYGQTGTGKTHTMEGVRGDLEQQGMIPKAFEQIWSHINRTQDMQFLVTTSYLEIYMEQIRDLLKTKNTKPLELRENEDHSVIVPNLHAVNCKSADEMLKVMVSGNKNRTVGYTNMNDHSSRSHAIFQISIEMCNIETNTVQVGKLNLIDLAGSERQSKSGAAAERLKEASKINRALSSLGNVISALAECSPHIPYRDSKLTRLLQDSLGGNSKTIMIANIGPASSNYEETLTTLRYAHRAKAINNKPIKNEDPKDAKLREYQQEIARLKLLIAERKQRETIISFDALDSRTTNSNTPSEDSETEEDSDVNELQKLELEKTIELEKLKTEELSKKLSKLENQLVRGGKNILDSMNEREMQIEKQMLEIAARKKREREMQQQLELEEETATGIFESFTTLQQEIEYKTNKMNKFHTRWQGLKQEIQDVKEEHIRDRRELEAAQDDLVKQLRLKCILLDNFIPPDERVKLFGRVEFNENRDDWVLLQWPVNKADLYRSIAQPWRRPQAEFALEKSRQPKSTRYRMENVHDLELDEPTNITCDFYKEPTVSPVYRSTLATYFNQEKGNNRIDVHEPPPSFQPRMFPRRELERRFEKASKTLSDFSPDNKHFPRKEHKPASSRHPRK